jgi:hypothetical protein
MRIRLALLTTSLLLVGVAFAQSQQSKPNDLDLHAYKRVPSLAKLFAANPRHRKAATELAPAGQWFLVEARYTGQRRKCFPAKEPLLTEWAVSRGFPSDLFDDDYPELEFEEGGKKYWIMVGIPAAFALDSHLKPQKLALFVQRVGFVRGKPFHFITLQGSPEDVARELAKPVPPPPPPKPEPVITRVAWYGHGEARVTYQGKSYVFPLDTHDSLGRPKGLFSQSDMPGKSLTLDFCTDAANCAIVDVFFIDDVRGNPPRLTFSLALDGHSADTWPTDDCKLTMKSATAELMSGFYDCAATQGKSPLGTVEFTARP